MKPVAEILGMDDKCWTDKGSVANTVAFKNLSNQCRITHDKAVKDAFLVHIDNRIVKFTRTKEGLYGFKFSEECLDAIREPNHRTTQETSAATTLIENWGNHSHRGL